MTGIYMHVVMNYYEYPVHNQPQQSFTIPAHLSMLAVVVLIGLFALLLFLLWMHISYHVVGSLMMCPIPKFTSFMCEVEKVCAVWVCVWCNSSSTDDSDALPGCPWRALGGSWRTQKSDQHGNCNIIRSVRKAQLRERQEKRENYTFYSRREK